MTQNIFQMVLAITILAAGNISTHAQNYPDKPVTIISTDPPGAGIDPLTRIIAARLTEIWGKTVVLQNKPGGNGVIATQAAAASSNDGYTLLVTRASSWNILLTQQTRFQIDLRGSFVPIGMLGEQPIALVVNKDVRASNLKELIELANAAPNGLLYAAAGEQARMTGEFFKRVSKANVRPLPYSAAANVSPLVLIDCCCSTTNKVKCCCPGSPGMAALADVTTGQISILLANLAALTPSIQNAQIKLLAVASDERLADLPDVPLMKETIPAFVSTEWVLLMAPMGTPDPIMQKINTDLRKAIRDLGASNRFYFHARDFDLAKAKEFLRGEEERWLPIARELYNR